jgi:hypothetical protein
MRPAVHRSYRHRDEHWVTRRLVNPVIVLMAVSRTGCGATHVSYWYRKIVRDG